MRRRILDTAACGTPACSRAAWSIGRSTGRRPRGISRGEVGPGASGGEPVGRLRPRVALLAAALLAVLAMPAASSAHPDAATDPALALGVVSTPAGGAYEWQYYATGMDRVPARVLTAAQHVTIAVLDTGADLSSPDLAGKIAGAYDVTNGGRDVRDTSGHGTFVASLAGAAAGNGIGMAGFGGDARLLIVKVADSSTATDDDVAAGILYAVRHGARVINVSLAGTTASPAERRAVRYAAAHGALLVAAAGNDALRGNAPEYPAALLQPAGSRGAGGVGLAVGASGFDGARASFSEHGSFLSLVAPGADVFGALAPGAPAGEFSRTLFGSGSGLYGFASGTSFAAPQVAGAAALVWAANPALTAAQVAAILKRTASGHGAWTPELGYGVLDVAAAVDAALAGRTSL